MRNSRKIKKLSRIFKETVSFFSSLCVIFVIFVAFLTGKSDLVWDFLKGGNMLTVNVLPKTFQNFQASQAPQMPQTILVPVYVNGSPTYNANITNVPANTASPNLDTNITNVNNNTFNGYYFGETSIPDIGDSYHDKLAPNDAMDLALGETGVFSELNGENSGVVVAMAPVSITDGKLILNLVAIENGNSFANAEDNQLMIDFKNPEVITIVTDQTTGIVTIETTPLYDKRLNLEIPGDVTANILFSGNSVSCEDTSCSIWRTSKGWSDLLNNFIVEESILTSTEKLDLYDGTIFIYQTSAGRYIAFQANSVKSIAFNDSEGFKIDLTWKLLSPKIQPPEDSEELSEPEDSEELSEPESSEEFSEPEDYEELFELDFNKL